MNSSGDKTSRDIIKIIQDERVAGAGLPFSQAEKDYVNCRVTGMKSIGTWNLAVGNWGIVGGTAASHKWNWKDMRDLNAAYRLTFINGATHNTSGVILNGTSQAIETYLPQNFRNSYSMHLGVYNRTSNIPVNGSVIDIGAWDGFGATNAMTILQIQSSAVASYLQYSSNNLQQAVLGTSSILKTGYCSANRESTSKIVVSANEYISTPQTGIIANTPLVTNTFNIGNVSPGNSGNLSNKNYCAAIIGAPFTDTQIIQQASLERFCQGILNRA